MSQKEPVIWRGRWEALMNTLCDNLYSLEHYNESWAVTIASTLRCLHTFGSKQFEFFEKGFRDGKLADSPRYKAEYPLRCTLDQAAFDLSVLQRAISQRAPELASQRERQTLEWADKLAYRALKPVISTGFLTKTTAITYLQKASHVRVVPYAPVAFVGIPYTCTGILDEDGQTVTTHTARDFLAIAHEVGHHIFWHGKKDNMSLRAWLRSQLSTYSVLGVTWLEEIFADVYGALIAGPVIALDFQELLYDNLDLWEDDGEHPVSAIRPYLYTYTLCQIEDREGQKLFIDAPTSLDKKWEALLSERGDRGSFTSKQGETAVQVTVEDAKRQLEKVADLILTLLQPVTAHESFQPWSMDEANPDARLYDEFKSLILGSSDITSPTLVSVEAGNGATGNEPDGTIEWEIGKSLTNWFSFLAEAGNYDLTLLPETWSTLLDGSGWVASGPENDADPK